MREKPATGRRSPPAPRTGAPRWVLLGACAAALPACLVPRERYEEAVASAHAEQAAHGATHARLREVEQELAALNAALEARQRSLEAKERDIARTKLEESVALKEREDAALIVDQLRDELARAGDHLRAFSDQKQQLSEALEEAERRTRELAVLEEAAAYRGMLVRDVTLALQDDLRRGELEVAFQGKQLRVLAPLAPAFTQGGMGLRRKAADWLERVGAALAPLEQSRVRLLATGHDWEAEEVIVRLQNVADALEAGGLALERIAFGLDEDRGEATDPDAEGAAPASPAPPKGESWLEVRVELAEPKASATPAEPVEGRASRNAPPEPRLAPRPPGSPGP